jgi:MFS transporter, OFA family, oxalate/formate antiporter
MAVRDNQAPPAPPATEAEDDAFDASRPRIYWGYWIVLAAFMAQLISIGTQMSVAGVFLKPMSEELGWTRADYTLAPSVGRFVMAFVGFLIGVYVDRYGGRVMMLIGVTIVAAALFMASGVTELWQWLIVKGFIFTVGAALIGNLVVNVTMAKWWVEKRGRMIGFSAMGVSLAGIVFPPMTTAMIDAWGWRTAWQALAIISLVVIYPAAMLMRRQPEDYGLHPDGRSRADVRRGAGAAAAADYANSFTRSEALRTPALYLIVISFGLGGVGIGAILLQTIPFLTDAGYSAATAAWLASTMSVPALISKPFWGWLIDKHLQPKKAAAIGFVMSGVALFIIVIATHGSVFPAVVGGFLLMGWGFGGQIPLQETIWGSYFGRRHLGAVRSVAMPISLAIGAGAPLGVSYYYDIVGDYNGIFMAIAALWVLAAVLVLIVRKPTKRSPAIAELPPDALPEVTPLRELLPLGTRRRPPRDYMNGNGNGTGPRA